MSSIVKLRRVELDLTQERAARRARVSRSAWSSIERGEKRASGIEAERIGRLLGIDAADVLAAVKPELADDNATAAALGNGDNVLTPLRLVPVGRAPNGAAFCAAPVIAGVNAGTEPRPELLGVLSAHRAQCHPARTR